MFDLLKKHKTYLILVLIFFGALFVRLFMLGSLPANMHEDEVLSGYVGRFIIQNGIDVYGNKWPLLYFNKFGDYYIILPFYLSGIGAWLFGTNAFGVRFFGAVLGAMAVFPVFLLSRYLFKSARVALLSALVIGIMPWHVNLSRTTVEGLMGTTIFTFGIVGLFRYLENRKIISLVSAGLFFAVSYFFYHPFRIYVPLTFIAFSILYFDKKIIRNNIGPALMSIIFVVMTIYIGSTQWGSGRFAQTSIFSPLSGVSIKIQERIFNEPDMLLARVFNNKVLVYGREFLYQYSRYFSPDVLFVTGGNSPRVAVPDQGLLYLIFLPIMLFGLYKLSRKDRTEGEKKNIIFLLYLLLLAPIPAGLTIIDSPNIHRAVFMTIPLSIMIGYGMHCLVTLTKYRLIILPIMILILCIEMAIFQHTYAVQSDLYTSVARNDGQREVVEYVSRNKHRYDRIYLPSEGNFPLYYLFYSNNLDKSLSTKIKLDIKINNIDNVYFVKTMCDSQLWKTKHVDKVAFIKLDDCKKMRYFRKVGKIHGVNKLHTYKIYSN